MDTNVFIVSGQITAVDYATFDQRKYVGLEVFAEGEGSLRGNYADVWLPRTETLMMALRNGWDGMTVHTSGNMRKYGAETRLHARPGSTTLRYGSDLTVV